MHQSAHDTPNFRHSGLVGLRHRIEVCFLYKDYQNAKVKYMIRNITGKLSFKIATTLTFFFLLSLSVVGSVYSLRHVSKTNDRIEHKIQSTKEWAEKTFVEAVWTYDVEVLSDLANILTTEPDSFIQKVTVYNRDDSAMVTSENTAFAGALNEDRIIKFKIFNGSDHVGYVEMVVRPVGFWISLWNELLSIWGTVILSTLFLAAVSFLVLERLLSSPISELINQVQQVENANYQITLKSKYSNELSILAKSFGRAVQAISERDRTLSKLATLGEVTANIVHEINNPLTVIQTSAQLLGNGLAKAHPESDLKRYVERITSMSKRVGKIVKTMKNYARTTDVEERQVTSINDIIEDVEILSSLKISASNVTFEGIRTVDDLKVFVEPTQVSQILVNLVQNAIDAVQGQQGARISIRAMRHGSFCLLKVIDNGPGIPTEITNQIFNPFFTTKPTGVGTGLGLSISKRIAEDHGGRLTYTRENNETIFELTVPIVRENEAAA